MDQQQHTHLAVYGTNHAIVRDFRIDSAHIITKSAVLLSIFIVYVLPFSTYIS